MKYHLLSSGVVALALLPILAFGVASSPQWELNARNGTVVLATATCLTMLTSSQNVGLGELKCYGLAPDARVTCNSRPCKLQDLKPGQRVEVTAGTGDGPMASRIAAFDDPLACRLDVEPRVRGMRRAVWRE